jgi:PAS domain S-box-containing protein
MQVHTCAVNMPASSETAQLTALPSDRQRALAQTLAAAAVATLTQVVAGLGIWLALSATIKADYQRYLSGLATTAALLVDPALHRGLTDPAQHNGPEYMRAVEPLRRMRTAMPEARYIYTVILDREQVRFVLDAATPGDHDGDGIEDQSQLREIYTESDPAMLVALGNGREPGQAAATDRPYDDKWGSFMTGWAPLIDAAGEQYGALGIDVDAGLYVAHLQRTRFWALVGALPATLLVLLGGIWFYRVRLRALAMTREAMQSSRQLGREQQRLRNVIEGTRVGVWEAAIDPDKGSHTITVDDRWAAMLGRRAAELNPITPDRFIPLLVHPEDAQAVLAAIDAALGEEERIFDMDARMRHADGRWIWTEVRGKVVERDAQGRPLQMVGTQMDVSDRKAAELSLQEQQGSFRSLFELSPVGICLEEFPSGRFLNANDAMLALVGYSREELLQLNYMDITPDEFREVDREQVALVERNTRFGPYVKEFMHKAGHRTRVLMSGARMKDAAGRDVLWIIVQDWNER